jgi:hypothetical protein
MQGQVPFEIAVRDFREMVARRSGKIMLISLPGDFDTLAAYLEMNIVPGYPGQIKEDDNMIRCLIDVRVGTPDMFTKGKRGAGDMKHVIQHILNFLFELAAVVPEFNLDVAHICPDPLSCLSFFIIYDDVELSRSKANDKK